MGTVERDPMDILCALLSGAVVLLWLGVFLACLFVVPIVAVGYAVYQDGKVDDDEFWMGW